MAEKDLIALIMQFGFAGVLVFVLWKLEPVMRSIKESLDVQTAALLLVLQKFDMNGDIVEKILSKKKN